MIYELRVYTAAPGRMHNLLVSKITPYLSGKSTGSSQFDSGQLWLDTLPES